MDLDAFTLADGDRESILSLLHPPFSWSHVRRDEELRYWRVMSETPSLVRLMHGTGAVALLSLQGGDRVHAVDLIEGEPAEALVREHGFPADAALVRRVQKAFPRGRPLPEGAARTLGAVPLPLPSPPSQVFYRLPEGPVVEVELAEARIQAVHVRTGGAALDLMQAAARLRRWSVPALPGGPLDARNAHEAALFLEVMQATWIDSRAEGDVYEVLARLPEGRRRFAFRLAAPTPEDPADFGEGGSTILDPVELVLYADRVQREAPLPSDTPAAVQRHARRLRMAAGALRQAARLAGDAAASLSPAALKTPAARRFAADHPERLRPQSLLRDALSLDQLAATWEGPAHHGALPRGPS